MGGGCPLPIYHSAPNSRPFCKSLVMDFKKLLIRTLSGLIYCLIIVGCILSGFWGILALAMIITVLSCVEFTKITHEMNGTNILTLIIDIAACITLCMVPVFPTLGLLWLGFIMARFIGQLYIKGIHPINDLASSMLMQIYFGGPMMIMTYFGNSSIPRLLLAMFFFLWINDTGAYLVGSLFGKHRLFERISPKKSWEGFFGGLSFNLVFAVIFGLYCNDFFQLSRIGAGIWFWVGFAALVTVFGTWGDLTESLIKRNLNIKDSGNLIPGHGGILDRIDSLLFVLPATFLYLFTYYCC